MNVLDLFSGIGGFSLGLERAGMRTVAFCEIEPYCRAVLRKHWPDVPIFEDVRKLTAADVSGVDVICGGFPCQDISVAGAQEGIEGERSGLWGEIRRLIGDIRPRYAIMENVTNLIAGENGEWFAKILGDLAALGYDSEWHCLRASRIGYPHQRDRVWILAHPTSERRDIQEGAAPALLSPKCLQNFEQSGSRWKREISGHSMERVGWKVEPAIRGSDDGIPDELAEKMIHALGNSIVPAFPEIIGRAIMQAEGRGMI